MPSTTALYSALERVNDHAPVPPEHQPRQRLWRIVAKRTVVAAGALERPVVFGGNDVPGVMLASAVRTYINRYVATPAKRLALFTNNDDGWKTVDAALAAGLTIAGRRRCTRGGLGRRSARWRPSTVLRC